MLELRTNTMSVQAQTQGLTPNNNISRNQQQERTLQDFLGSNNETVELNSSYSAQTSRVTNVESDNRAELSYNNIPEETVYETTYGEVEGTFSPQSGQNTSYVRSNLTAREDNLRAARENLEIRGNRIEEAETAFEAIRLMQETMINEAQNSLQAQSNQYQGAVIRLLA